MDQPETTIYVVDQHKSVRDGMRILFSTPNVTVVTFATAAEFLRNAPGSSKACLIVDADLPDMDSVAHIEHLREHGRTMPTVVLATESDIPTAVRAMRAGAVDYIEKPPRTRQLTRRIVRTFHIDRSPPAQVQ